MLFLKSNKRKYLILSLRYFHWFTRKTRIWKILLVLTNTLFYLRCLRHMHHFRPSRRTFDWRCRTTAWCRRWRTCTDQRQHQWPQPIWEQRSNCRWCGSSPGPSRWLSTVGRRWVCRCRARGKRCRRCRWGPPASPIWPDLDRWDLQFFWCTNCATVDKVL